MGDKTFETADAAVDFLIESGFEKTGYDPLYPYSLVHGDQDAVFAKVFWDETKEAYVIDHIPR